MKKRARLGLANLGTAEAWSVGLEGVEAGFCANRKQLGTRVTCIELGHNHRSGAESHAPSGLAAKSHEASV